MPKDALADGALLRGLPRTGGFASCRGSRPGKLDDFTFWRLGRMLKTRHGWNWGQLRRHLTAASGP